MSPASESTRRWWEMVASETSQPETTSLQIALREAAIISQVCSRVVPDSAWRIGNPVAIHGLALTFQWIPWKCLKDRLSLPRVAALWKNLADDLKLCI